MLIRKVLQIRLVAILIVAHNLISSPLSNCARRFFSSTLLVSVVERKAMILVSFTCRARGPIFLKTSPLFACSLLPMTSFLILSPLMYDKRIFVFWVQAHSCFNRRWRLSRTLLLSAIRSIAAILVSYSSMSLSTCSAIFLFLARSEFVFLERWSRFSQSSFLCDQDLDHVENRHQLSRVFANLKANFQLKHLQECKNYQAFVFKVKSESIAGCCCSLCS